MSEAKFIVGQWVTCNGIEYQVELIRGGKQSVKLSNRGWTHIDECQPFVWKVGKTYKTTLDGVTARINGETDSIVSGVASDKDGTLCFDRRTGVLLGYKPSVNDVPHLLPYLADEPQPVAEAATSSQFAKVQVGDYVRWNGRDYKIAKVDKEDETLLVCSLAVGAQPTWIGWADVESFVLAERKPCGVVNHPPHYTQHPSGVECCDIVEHFNFCVGNAIKYLWRAGLKGDALEDLRKAAWYVQREIERREKNST